MSVETLGTDWYSVSIEIHYLLHQWFSEFLEAAWYRDWYQTALISENHFSKVEATCTSFSHGRDPYSFYLNYRCIQNCYHLTLWYISRCARRALSHEWGSHARALYRMDRILLYIRAISITRDLTFMNTHASLYGLQCKSFSAYKYYMAQHGTYH